MIGVGQGRPPGGVGEGLKTNKGTPYWGHYGVIMGDVGGCWGLFGGCLEVLGAYLAHPPPTRPHPGRLGSSTLRFRKETPLEVHNFACF